MKPLPFSSQLLITSTLLGLLTIAPACAKSPSNHNIEPLQNLALIAEKAQEKQIPILLVFSSENCPFCVQVEEDFLKPMLISGQYENKVIIRKVRIDGPEDLTNFDGNTTTVDALKLRYSVFVVPTVIVINDTGKEVGERLIGINTADYYGAYLDQSIDQGIESMRYPVTQSQP